MGSAARRAVMPLGEESNVARAVCLGAEEGGRLGSAVESGAAAVEVLVASVAAAVAAPVA